MVKELKNILLVGSVTCTKVKVDLVSNAKIPVTTREGNFPVSSVISVH